MHLQQMTPRKSQISTFQHSAGGIWFVNEEEGQVQ
jgi:hypothetical protein